MYLVVPINLIEAAERADKTNQKYSPNKRVVDRIPIFMSYDLS